MGDRAVRNSSNQSIQVATPFFDRDKLYMQKQKELWVEGIHANKEVPKLILVFGEGMFDNLEKRVLTGG